VSVDRISSVYWSYVRIESAGRDGYLDGGRGTYNDN
jgi:hypothetical protein